MFVMAMEVMSDHPNEIQYGDGPRPGYVGLT